MDLFSISEHGNATRVYNEPFSMKFEFTDFEVQETYVEVNDGVLHRKIYFPKQVSSGRVIGQKINFPSSWRVAIQCKDAHARVALELGKLHGHVQPPGPISKKALPYALVKFKISFIDKNGDILYAPEWQSWQLPKKIGVNSEHAMPNYISLLDLFDTQALYAPNKTLRVLCEGVLFGSFTRLPFSNQKPCPFPLTPRPDLLTSGEGCDVHVVAASGKSFKAHKLVLSKASHVFQKLLSDLSGGAGIPSLTLNKLTESNLEDILHYIYTGNPKQGTDWSDCQQVEKLVKIAKDYELRGLEWLCYRNLLKAMTLSSFTQVAKILHANSVKDENLRSFLSGYFIRNQELLAQSAEFKTFADEEKGAFQYIVLFSGKGDS